MQGPPCPEGGILPQSNCRLCLSQLHIREACCGNELRGPALDQVEFCLATLPVNMEVWWRMIIRKNHEAHSKNAKNSTHDSNPSRWVFNLCSKMNATMSDGRRSIQQYRQAKQALASN
jgi:hypothetical protein